MASSTPEGVSCQIASRPNSGDEDLRTCGAAGNRFADDPIRQPAICSCPRSPGLSMTLPSLLFFGCDPKGAATHLRYARASATSFGLL